MAKTIALPAYERLHELFEIVLIAESEFGIQSGLVWKVSRRGRARKGSVAGSKVSNFKQPSRFDWLVGVDRKIYLASRVLYLMANGVDPGELTVDHEDQNSLNNNIWNLRIADHVLQKHNQKQRSTNTSGATGVYWNKRAKKWLAQLRYDGRRRSLGYFTCKIEAAHVWNEKVIELGFDKLGKPLNNLSELTCNCELHRQALY